VKTDIGVGCSRVSAGSDSQMGLRVPDTDAIPDASGPRTRVNEETGRRGGFEITPLPRVSDARALV